MKQKRVYRCDGSVDGIFTAIYDAFDSRYGHANIVISENDADSNLELFTEYMDIPSDEYKARKVAESISKKISPYAYEIIIKSALSNRVGRSDAIYRFLQLGFSVGKSVVNQLNHPYVYPLFQMERRVNNEVLHYLGFVRFRELENKILLSEIRPENNILSLIAPHFEDRLAGENWIIYDRGRNIAGIHRSCYPWIMVNGNELNQNGLKEFSDSEENMQFYFQTFVDTIGIKERFNEKLQRQMLPNRYREFMREVPYKERGRVSK